jgi:hypothetical protein
MINTYFPEEAVEEVSGGLWDCPAGLIDPRSGSPGGSGFVASIDAVKATTPVSKLSKKSLYAISVPADAGSVKTTTVKVNGKRVKVFTYQVTIPTDPNVNDADPAPGHQLLAASTEPHAHLLISATTSKPPRESSPILTGTSGTRCGISPPCSRRERAKRHGRVRSRTGPVEPLARGWDFQ